MALQRQLVEFGFGQGLNTKIDPKQIPLGQLLVLQNALFTTPGKLSKRGAVLALTENGAIGACAALFGRENEICEIDASGNFYSYDGSRSAWVSRGKMPSVTTSVSPLATPQYTTYAPDIALAANGLICSVYELQDVNGGGRKGIGYTVVDSVTGQIVVPPAILDNSAAWSVCPRVICFTNTFVCYYVNGDGTTTEGIYGRTLDGTNPTAAWSAATQLTSGTTTSAVPVSVFKCQFDACVSGSNAYLSFNNRSSGTTLFRIASASPLAVASTTNIASTTSTGTCVFPDVSGDIILGFVTDLITGAYNVKFSVYDSTLASQKKAATLIDTSATPFYVISGVSTAANSDTIFAGNAATNNTQFIRSVSIAGALYTPAAATTLIRSLNIAGKPFVLAGAAYIPAWYSPNTAALSFGRSLTPQNGIYLLDSAGNVVSKALTGTAGCMDTLSAAAASVSSSYVLPSTVVSTNVYLPATTSNILTSSSTIPAWAGYGFGFFGSGTNPYGFFTPSATVLNYNFGTSLLTFNFSDATNRYLRAELANTIHTSGGVLQMYDGQNLVEHGFFVYPSGLSASTAGSGGNLSAGKYQYIATYEWMDGQGQLHRSTPSAPLTVTALANDKATLTIPTLRVTAKTGVMIQVYRTAVNGTTFYQISNFNQSGSLYNDKTVDSVTWQDTQADTAITASPQIYTTGNVLPNAPCNPAGPMAVHRNRLFVVDSTNPTQVWYSKTVVAGTPVEFSGFAMLNVDPKGGPVTALASLDDKLIVFKRDRIFMVLGDGPDATGAQNNFTDAMTITADTGCASPKTVVLVPDGLLFQSPKGMYLLTRALQMVYKPAPDGLLAIGTIGAGVIVPDKQAVLYAMQGGATAFALWYDYFTDQWSTFSTSVGTISCSDVAVINSVPYLMNTIFGLVLKVTPASGPGTGNDNFGSLSATTVPVVMKATTGWIKLSQMQGFQRVYSAQVLGSYLGAHTLNIQLAYDYAGAAAETKTFAVSADPAPYQFSASPARQKCEAIQVTIFDSFTSTLDSQSFDLSGLALEIGYKGKLKVLPAAQTA